MTNTLAIVCITLLLVIFVVALIVNKPWREQLLIKFRGRTEQLARNDAATPEGAADYYNNAIREKENLYSNANRSYTEIAGKLEETEKEEYLLRKELMKIDKQINDCLDQNLEDEARQYAVRKVTTTEKIEILNETLEELRKAKVQQEEIRDAIKAELDDLKAEKERTIYRMEADQQIIRLHEGMNTEASTSESDRMLERVREGAKKTRERAAGSQAAYETSAAAQNRRLEAAEREREVNDVLNNMKRQRGNRN